MARSVEKASGKGDVDRTVLVLGRTGSGKSTLANVLAGAHTHLGKRETFKESAFGCSETKQAQEWIVALPDGKKMRVVDTIGIGDTGLSQREVLLQLAQTCHYLRNGISQILFVSTGRFIDQEQQGFNLLLRKVLFDEEVSKYVTIVRTRAGQCDDLQWCDEDITRTKRISDEVREIFDSAAGIIHVNNPNEYDNPHDWAKRREKTRKKLLEMSENWNETYLPPRLKKVTKEIDAICQKYEDLQKACAQAVEEKEKLQAELQQKSGELESMKKRLIESGAYDEDLRRMSKELERRSKFLHGDMKNIEEEIKRLQLKLQESETLVADEMKSFIPKMIRKAIIGLFTYTFIRG